MRRRGVSHSARGTGMGYGQQGGQLISIDLARAWKDEVAFRLLVESSQSIQVLKRKKEVRLCRNRKMVINERVCEI